MSKITNYGLTRSGTGYYIAVPIIATMGRHQRVHHIGALIWSGIIGNIVRTE